MVVIGSDISILMSAGVPGGGSRKGTGVVAGVVKENTTVSFGFLQISPFPLCHHPPPLPGVGR